MHAASTYEEEERRQFAFLARLFPLGCFIELSASCPLDARLALAKLYADKSTKRFFVISAGQVVNAEKMVPLIMDENFADLIPEKAEALCQNWCEKNSETNTLLHAHFNKQMAREPDNLVKIDDKWIELLDVARHLGIPLELYRAQEGL